MEKGKDICEKLKQIRIDIARANNIDYHPTPCEHEGDCDGTCPACESELKYLEEELSKKNQNVNLVDDTTRHKFFIREEDFEPLMGRIISPNHTEKDDKDIWDDWD